MFVLQNKFLMSNLTLPTFVFISLQIEKESAWAASDSQYERFERYQTQCSPKCILDVEKNKVWKPLVANAQVDGTCACWSLMWVSDSVTQWLTNLRKILNCYSQLKTTNIQHLKENSVGRLIFILQNQWKYPEIQPNFWNLMIIDVNCC